MKLHFIYADTHEVYCLAQCGIKKPVQKRIVTIELTPEQVKAIKPKCVGKSQDKDVYEELFEVIPDMPGIRDDVRG